MEKKNYESKVNAPTADLLKIARILGIIWVVLCLFGLIGYGIEGYQRNGLHIPEDWLGFATVVFLLAGLAGLVVAIWKPGTGGFTSLIGFTASGILLMIDPHLLFNPVFCLLYVPTILYLLHWWDTRKH